jgi:hypothetical protein
MWIVGKHRAKIKSIGVKWKDFLVSGNTVLGEAESASAVVNLFCSLLFFR